MTFPRIASARIGIGLLQGLALLALYEAFENHVWPATDGLTFAPLLTVAIFIPVILLSGFSNLRARPLVVWSIGAALVCVGLGFYDILRDPLAPAISTAAAAPRMVPSPSMWLSVAAMLFIVHTLTVSGEADRRAIAEYPTHFDVAWKHGVQFALAAAFVFVFWGLLFLGADLFRLIKIDFLWELIRRPTFSIPVTMLTFSYAVHITDVRAAIVRGTRTIALVLLSWLLPVMTLLAAAFLVTVPFAGLESLWSTRRATTILLIVVAALVSLVNAAYQDGRPENRAATALRYASLVAAVLLLPFIALSTYALMLRVGQYGWTTDRIIALAAIFIATWYGVGYLLAAARSGAALRGLERTNLYTSIVIVGVLLALRTPVADPARLAVLDQVVRLESAKVSPEQFDFAFLRFDAGRYGMAALERLSAQTEGPRAEVIAARAAQVLRTRSRQEIAQTTPERRAGNTVISPSNGKLPERFVGQDWGAFPRRWLLPGCLVSDAKCEAVLTDLDGDGKPEILLFSLPAGTAAGFKTSADGTWAFLGTILNASCAGVRDALRAGRFTKAQPLLEEIEANGQRLRINTECPEAQGR
jgi:hypothetical protein